MTNAHAARAHATLSPSASHRWMECPGSIRLSEGIPDKSSSYAAEGTAAHELAAHCLNINADPVAFLGTVIDIAGGSVGEIFTQRGIVNGITRFEVTDEMVDAVRTYIEAVDEARNSVPGELAEVDIEQRLDMTHIHPAIFGTGDAVVYVAATGRLHVFDFKYGKGVAVEVTENPQLLLYGAGAVRRRHNRRIDEIVLTIVQPRAPHAKGPVRRWATDALSLMEFEDEVSRLAKATDAPDAPLHAGEHCRFCKAQPICPEAREKAQAAALAEFNDGAMTVSPPEKLSGEQLAEVLRQAEFLGNWLKAVQEFAHAEAVAGRTPPGFKLVQKRATRKWRDEAAVKDKLVLDLDLSSEDFMTAPELMTPAALEKVVGKKAFAAIFEVGDDPLVKKVSSGTNLVLESDPRPAVKADALAEFGEG